MSNSKPNYFQRRTKPQGPRANERIRALDVQVIASDGGNLGAMPLKKAIELASQPDKIISLKRKILDLNKSSNLFKPKKFTLDLESKMKDLMN